MKLRFAAVIAAVFLLAGWFVAAEELRTWTSADGAYKTKASFLKLEDQKVFLEKEDGKQINLPLKQLSAKDREYVREEVLRRKQAAGPTTPVAAKVSAGATKVAAGEWPRWRGPNNDGISGETGLLDEWPADGPPLLWQVEGLGSGFGSVAISGGKIFVMGRSAGMDNLMALSAKDGSPLWSVAAGPGSRERGPNCTPTVDGDRVYGLTIDGDLLCADAASGREVWRKSYSQDFGGRMMSGWGYSESPLVDGDRLICTPGGQQAMLACLDKKTGNVIWTTEMRGGGRGNDGAGYSSPVISNAAGVKQYVQLIGHGVIGVDAKTGRLLWQYDRIANGTANIPTPICTGNYVFCSTGYGEGGTALLELTGGNGGVNVREVWYKSANEMQNHHGGMILLGDFVYFGNKHNQGFPLCVNMKTGEVAWEPGRGAGGGSAAIVYADGDLYFRYQSGDMALIEATPKGYNLKSSFKIGSHRGDSWPHPVIADGKLYLRDQEALLCYDIKAK